MCIYMYIYIYIYAYTWIEVDGWQMDMDNDEAACGWVILQAAYVAFHDDVPVCVGSVPTISHIQAVGLSRIDWRKVVSHLRARSVSHCFWLFCIRYILVMDHFSLLCAGFCWYMFSNEYILLSAFTWWYHCKLVGANVLFVHLFIFEGNICCHLDRGILPRWTGAFCSEPGYVSNGVGKIMNNGVRMEDRSNS